MNAGLILLLLLVLGCGFLLLAFSIVMHYVTRWRDGGGGSSHNELAQIQSQLEQIRIEMNQLKERQAEMTILMDDLSRSRLER
ncbi:MAG: hypothetical protein OXT69_14285 [Candidatus Poribacteria bacterium]|nr:hypothetical protein [Candidatus Poribacteria bacterium]